TFNFRKFIMSIFFSCGNNTYIFIPVYFNLMNRNILILKYKLFYNFNFIFLNRSRFIQPINDINDFSYVQNFYNLIYFNIYKHKVWENRSSLTLSFCITLYKR